MSKIELGTKMKGFDFQRFEKIRYRNEQKHQEFRNGKRNFLIIQEWDTGFYNRCNSKKDLLEAFLEGYSKGMNLETDHIPYIEPWHGVGVFANAFGCEVNWIKGGSPWTKPVFNSIEQVRDIKKPRPKDSKVMSMVLETIRYFKKKTGGVIPISFTDTQSPFDTASLIMETNTFFSGFLSESVTMHHFIGTITELIIEFSKIQQDEIGDVLIKPGHIMASSINWSGISLSDDNMVMISPQIYKEFSGNYNSRIAKEFGGVAIHSCGNWGKSVKVVRDIEGLLMVDAAFSKCEDPAPNEPRPFYECFSGSGIVVQARIDYRELEKAKKLVGNEMKVVFKIGGFTDKDSFEMRNEIISEWRQVLSNNNN